jgi:hypothetical protein
LKIPHLSGPSYQNPEQVAQYVLQKCTELLVQPSGVPGVRREGEAVYVTVAALPRKVMMQNNIKRAVRRAFGMNNGSACGANPHPAHDVVIDVNDNHVRLYTSPRS